MKNKIRPSKLFSVFASVFILAHLAGCGIAQEGDDSEAAQRRRQNDRLEKQYTAVRGLYKGTLKIKSPVAPDPADPGKNEFRDLGGSLLLYIGTVQEGFDRAGAPIFHPRLFAQLKFDGVGELDDTTFLVDYNEVTGKVYFQQPQASAGSPGGSPTNPVPVGTVTSCPVGPRDARLQIDAIILGGMMKDGNVYGTNGQLGAMNMKREISGDIQPIRDQRERLERAYSKILGTWRGSAGVSSPRGIVDADASIYLTTDEVTIGEGVTCPVLKSQFRLNQIVGQVDDTFLNASYREGTGELFLTATPPPANRKVCSMGPQDLKLAVVGQLDNNKLTGLLKGSVGNQGRVAMTKISTNPIAPDDQRDRIYGSYSKVTGVYAGYLDTGMQTRNFPFRLDVDVVDVVVDQFLTCYALRAQYTRPDLVSGAGALVLNADFNPIDNRLVLNSTTNSSTGIPGHTDLRLSGKWQPTRGGGATINGPMQWWDRNGTATARKCPRGNHVDRKGKCVR